MAKNAFRERCQSLLLTQIDSSWQGGVRELIGHMRPGPHRQRRGNPLERHSRFGPQPPRNLHFPGIPFAQLAQARLRPSPPLEFLAHNPPRPLLSRFLPLHSVVIAPHLGLRGLQQFLPKGFVPQIPSAPQTLRPSCPVGSRPPDENDFPSGNRRE